MSKDERDIHPLTALQQKLEAVSALPYRTALVGLRLVREALPHVESQAERDHLRSAAQQLLDELEKGRPG